MKIPMQLGWGWHWPSGKRSVTRFDNWPFQVPAGVLSRQLRAHRFTLHRHWPTYYQLPEQLSDSLLRDLLAPESAYSVGNWSSST
jgi:hypothetical protein